MHFEDINLDNGYTPSHAYGRSKTANILFARELGKRLKGILTTELILSNNFSRLCSNLFSRSERENKRKAEKQYF